MEKLVAIDFGLAESAPQCIMMNERTSIFAEQAS